MDFIDQLLDAFGFYNINAEWIIKHFCWAIFIVFYLSCIKFGFENYWQESEFILKNKKRSKILNRVLSFAFFFFGTIFCSGFIFILLLFCGYPIKMFVNVWILNIMVALPIVLWKWLMKVFAFNEKEKDFS